MLQLDRHWDALILDLFLGVADCAEVRIHRLKKDSHLLDSIQRYPMLRASALPSSFVVKKPTHAVFAFREVEDAMIYSPCKDHVGKTLKVNKSLRSSNGRKGKQIVQPAAYC